MPRQVMRMSLAFEACQKLDLPVQCHAERLPDYLQQEERVLGALLDSRQLTKIKPGHYRYLVTSCLLYTSPSPRDATLSRMPSSA